MLPIPLRSLQASDFLNGGVEVAQTGDGPSHCSIQQRHVPQCAPEQNSVLDLLQFDGQESQQLNLYDK
jgi:hypothetical protein